jgi:hypothetical protein
MYIYSGSQKSEVSPMPYALCPMPYARSYLIFRLKGYILLSATKLTISGFGP